MTWEKEWLDAKAPAEAEEMPHHSRKDTKRWCRGKIGREHQPTYAVNKNYGRTECRPQGIVFGLIACIEREVCASCGKVLRHHLRPEECRLVR